MPSVRRGDGSTRSGAPSAQAAGDADATRSDTQSAVAAGDADATAAPRPIVKAALARRPWMELPDTYGRVEGLLRDGHPAVFVSGSAGTGKTTLIRYLNDILPQRTVVVAPTGVAALNVGGVTIHSFFKFPPRIQDPSEIRTLADPKMIQSLDLLVIDEVSMVRCDLMDAMDLFLRKNRGSGEPFGGVQLLLVGDLFQLPPVVPRHESQVLEDRGYAGPYFFNAFGLRELSLAHVELERVYRQEDPDFVGLLNRLRVAEDLDRTVAEINRSCLGEPDDRHDLTLTCTNRRADDINRVSMAALDSTEHVFRGEIDGRFRLDTDKLPAPLELRLKNGAHVMFTKNDEMRRWVNGSPGVVVGLSEDSVHVRVGGPDGRTHEVEPVAWEAYEYAFDAASRRIEARKIGEYRQYPLMLAWAVTIHKSQGKTLERVLVDFGTGAFSPGQAYVALSRCRSLDAVRLARPLRNADIRCDPAIRDFYERLARAGG